MVKRRILKKRTPVGAPPGTYVADPSSEPTTIGVFRYDSAGLSESPTAGLDDVEAAHRAKGVAWINVNGLADISLIERIGKIFGLHQLALEDVINVHQRPKVEEFEDHLFVVTRMLAEPASGETEQISMFLGKGYILTFQERPGDVFEPVRHRLRTAKGRIRQAGADYLAYALLDAVIDGYFPALEARGENIARLEELVVDDPRRRLAHDIHEARHDLFMIRRSVWPQRDMLNALIRHESGLIDEQTRIYLRDCYDHTVQLIDIVETYREICAGLFELFLSRQSNRMNEIMKVLTVMASIFIPLSFIAGVYGMNFDTGRSPWNMPELRWTFGYPFALGLMSAVALGLLIAFWRRGWIGGR